MIVGILSDSHDNLPVIRQAVQRLKAEGAETLIHAGDFIAPFSVKALVEFPGEVIAVFGNNDGERDGIRKALPSVSDPPRVEMLDGRTFVIVHDVAQATENVLETADVLIYGHSHEPVIERTHRLTINPGECGGWVNGRCTAALLDTQTLEARVIDIA